MRHGLHGILVDHPPLNYPGSLAGVRTKADEKKAGVRPYLTHYTCDSLLGWETERDDAGVRLVQLRLRETVTEKVSRFVTDEIPQIRVLEPGRWETWRKLKTASGKFEWVLHESGATSIDVIPFVFFYGHRHDFGIGRSPLRDLAHLSILHWQSSSDQENILSVARCPILFATGNVGDNVTVGPSSFVTGKQDSDLKYVEHSGAAIEAGRQSILDLEDKMRMVGAELLAERTGLVTARQVIAETEDNRSILQRTTEDAEASWESVLRLVGLWSGEKLSPRVEMFKDFGFKLPSFPDQLH
jgi:hypothetical protein